MTGQPQHAAAKVCIACGCDCSNRPRTKDQQGRYTCRDCFDKRSRPTAAPVQRTPAAAAVAADADEVQGADDPGIMAALLDGVAPAAPAVAPCPECGHPLAAGVVICTHCGLNARTGKTLATRQAEGVEPAPGSPVRVGPKSEKDKVRDFEAREAQRIAQMEFLKPILIGGAALGGIAAMLLTQHQGDRFLPPDKYALFYLGSFAAASIVFVLASFVRIGRDSITGINFVRLAAIVAVVDLLRLPVILFLGDTFLLWAGLLLMYMCLLYFLLDLDVSDAIIVGVLLGGAQIAAGFIIIQPLIGK